MTTETDSKTELKKSAEAVADTASKLARDATETAKSKIEATTAQARDGIASEMQDTAAALRRAAQEVRDGSPQGSTFSYLADGLADMADSVKGQNVSDLFGIVNDFARRNPVAFLGGAALLGFATSRFAKASGPQDTAATHNPYAAPRPAMPSAHSTAYNPNMPHRGADHD